MTWRTTLALLRAAMGTVLALVGTIDAIRRGDTVSAWLFGAVAVICASFLAPGRHRTVRPRGDHYVWLERASAVTGEPVDVVADRAIGTYRDGR